jgi:hypothetical protein
MVMKRSKGFRGWAVGVFVGVSCGVGLWASPAHAEEAGAHAVIRVPDRDDSTFAAPPAGEVVLATDREVDHERQRSPFRITLGPTAMTAGKGLGYGVFSALDFGRGTVGGRLTAAWLRGDANLDGDSSSSPSPLGTAVGQYTGEITVDLLKRGPLHPTLGVGAGVLHVSHSDGSGFAGIGTARVGLDYALALEEADVRVGASVLGGMVGPADHEVTAHAYAMTMATITIGF